MYALDRRTTVRRRGFAGFGAVEQGWEPMQTWKNRVTYVRADIVKAITAVTPTAAASLATYFYQAQAKVTEAAALIKVEEDLGEWTRFREEKISAKFAEARGLYKVGAGSAASLSVTVPKMSTWGEPGYNPNPPAPPTVTPTIVKVATTPPPVVTTPTGVSATPAPGGGIAIVGQPGGVFERYPMVKVLDQVVAGLPLWQWGVVGGVGLLGLGFAAKVLRLAAFGGVVAGGAYAAKNWPKLMGLVPREG